jgi:hypothetical protein
MTNGREEAGRLMNNMSIYRYLRANSCIERHIGFPGLHAQLDFDHKGLPSMVVLPCINHLYCVGNDHFSIGDTSKTILHKHVCAMMLSFPASRFVQTLTIASSHMPNDNLRAILEVEPKMYMWADS